MIEPLVFDGIFEDLGIYRGLGSKSFCGYVLQHISVTVLFIP